MNWIIQGLDRSTGEPRITNVTADTETHAIKLASQEGVVTQHIQPIVADPVKMHAGIGLWRDGKPRDRYLFFMIWACRVGGICFLFMSLWIFKLVLFPSELQRIAYDDNVFVYWLIGGGLFGIGAAVALVGELTAEIIESKLRARSRDSG